MTWRAHGLLSQQRSPPPASSSAAAAPADMPADPGCPEKGTRLVLPCDDPDGWAYVQEVLRGPLATPADVDAMLTKFSALDREPRVCTFFQDIPGTEETGLFDFDEFSATGLPLLRQVALDMPALFEGVEVPIFKTAPVIVRDPQDRSHSWTETLGRRSVSLSRQQCACLLAHSFFGSLKRPASVQPNDFRFTVSDMFVGSARSPTSATVFLNYWSMLARHGFAQGCVTFERRGYRRGPSPWHWEGNARSLCAVRMADGALEDSPAEVHAEFANGFVGGGVMTGDCAMEELLFLVKPELMVCMAIQNRMSDTEAICVSGALQYSLVRGYGSSFVFAGDYDHRREGPPPTVCAIDAVRGGGPAMTERALLRDLNKARIAFDGACDIATGHWGCGAFGNNHDLMFLKQWLAASEAGARTMYYHDFSRQQSHNVVPLTRRLRHLTVGQLWSFLRKITDDLQPANVAQFSIRMREVAAGKRPLPDHLSQSFPQDQP